MIINDSPENQHLIRILAIDEESDQLDLLKFYLEMDEPSLTVELISSPKKSLEIIKERNFDCIISDYMMPSMNGLALAHKVKEICDIPFILYTGKGSEEVASEAIDEGVDGYVRKEPDLKHYKILAKRVKYAVKRQRDQMKYLESIVNEKWRQFTGYPKVEAREKAIIVIEENGREKLLGYEENHLTAHTLAQDIQKNLGAVNYLKNYLENTIFKFTDNIKELNTSTGRLEKKIKKECNKIWNGISKIQNTTQSEEHTLKNSEYFKIDTLDLIIHTIIEYLKYFDEKISQLKDKTDELSSNIINVNKKLEEQRTRTQTSICTLQDFLVFIDGLNSLLKSLPSMKPSK